MTLRKRLEHSKFLAWLIGLVVNSYLVLCLRTTRWDIRGIDALKADLADGPVLFLMWHGRLLFAPHHWPHASCPLASIHDTSPIGKVVGAVHRRVGLKPMEMSGRLSNMAASRIVLKRFRDGASIGMAADGPKGPNHVMQDAPLEWARVMKRPIYGYAFSVKRHRILGSWDKMMLPLPFTRGYAVFERYEGTMPLKGGDATSEAARAGLSGLLDGVLQDADKAVS